MERSHSARLRPLISTTSSPSTATTTRLEPQRLLGAVVTALHAQPLLSADNINSAASSFGFLAGSGLDSQIERVRFTPTGLSLEEFSKLWSVFFQVEYSPLRRLPGFTRTHGIG